MEPILTTTGDVVILGNEESRQREIHMKYTANIVDSSLVTDFYTGGKTNWDILYIIFAELMRHNF